MKDTDAYKTVLKDLMAIDMFVGLYDAKHGNENFMNGIWTVMEVIACGVGEECADVFDSMFVHNLNISEDKANNEMR